MKSTEVADRYAEAIYELGDEEGKLDELVDDLSAVRNAISSSEDFALFLEHPLVPGSDKIDVLDNLFSDRISRESFNFLKLLIDNGREDYLELIFERVLDIRSEKENILNANVFVPEQFETAVSAEEYADRLSKRLGKKVVVNRVIGDPSLIAGIKVQIGNRIIDGSAKSRIKQMRDFVLEGGKDG